MAKSKSDRELYKTLRSRGVRKRVARACAKAAPKAGYGTAPDPLRRAAQDLKAVVDELENRVVTGPELHAHAGGGAVVRKHARRN